MPAGAEPGSALRPARQRSFLSASLRRAGRRTNLGLLLLLIGSFGSGWVAFATAGPVSGRLAAVTHGALGLGLVVLTPWKLVVVRRASRLRVLSLALAVVVVVCIVAGVVEVLVGPDGDLLDGDLTPIQVHVGAAFVLVALLVVHVVRHWRPRLARASDLGRRRLLRTAGFGAAAAGAYVAVDLVGHVTGVAQERAPTGSHRIAAAEIPATIWILDPVPDLDWDAHRVMVGGVRLSPADLDGHGQAVRARLDCTTGWYADAVWTGVPLSELLDPRSLVQARSVVVTSVTGYRRRFALDALPRLFLATRVEGNLLERGTGAPVRLVAPGHRGFWWVKWVASVETSALPVAAQAPFPLQ